MPTYTYECTKCNHVFDGQYTIADRETPLLEPCSSCDESGSIIKIKLPLVVCLE